MKKNPNEIAFYFENVIISTSNDKKKIESFLKKSRLDVKVKRKRDNGKCPKISFEDFLEWYNYDLPQKDDCIAVGNHIGIVKKTAFETVVLGVSLDGVSLVTENIEISFKGWRKATGVEEVKLQNELYRLGLSWSRYHNDLIQSKVFKENNFVRITRLGRHLGLGIFKEITQSELVLFAYLKYDNDKTLYYDFLHVIIGKPQDFQIEGQIPKEREEFIEVLKDNDLEWNGHYNRLQPISWRAAPGETYFYINDCLSIVPTTDDQTPKHIRRYRSGNYFRNKKDAEIIINLISETRKQQLITSIFPSPKKRKSV